ncbi:MAG: hypothetical protein AB7E81_04045 [Hyphomicrobiaceae bacterium]
MATVVAPVKTSGVDWKSVFAGAIAAVAISGLLTAFGAAVGLSATSAHRNAGASVTAVAIATAIWLVMVHIWSFAAGGYLTGRLSDVPDLDPPEAQFRAGANGFMVWALGTVAGLAFLTFAAGTVAKSTANVVGQTASGVAQAASNVSAGNVSYVADALFRAQAAQPGATPPPVQQNRPDPAVVAEAGRIFTVGLAEGSLNSGDRDYLAQVVSRQTGMSQADAQRRVDETYARAQSMKESAEQHVREAADKARKQGVLVGFLTAAASLMGLVAATWAAGLGREHQNTSEYPRLFASEHFW